MIHYLIFSEKIGKLHNCFIDKLNSIIFFVKNYAKNLN